MKNTNLPTLESMTKWTLKFNDILYIPMNEQMTAKLFVLLSDQERQNKIREWLNTAGIKILHYNETRDIFKPSNEVLLEVFWDIIHKVPNTTEEYRLTYYKNIMLNLQRSKANNLEEIKSFINIVANYSHTHIKVLKLSDGIIDYLISTEIPTTNTIPATLAHCIEYGIDELQVKDEEMVQIWNDLLKTGLRKEASIHMFMNYKKFVWMSLTSDYGKNFLRIISRYG